VLVGATLLYDSVRRRRAKTRLKAAALLAFGGPAGLPSKAKPQITRTKRILLVDHQGSFVHTPANYQTGAEVIRCAGFPEEELDRLQLILLCLSGPACQKANVSGHYATLAASCWFGVCLELRGMVDTLGALGCSIIPRTVNQQIRVVNAFLTGCHKVLRLATILYTL
jgi:hypothetical protein